MQFKPFKTVVTVILLATACPLSVLAADGTPSSQELRRAFDFSAEWNKRIEAATRDGGGVIAGGGGNVTKDDELFDHYGRAGLTDLDSAQLRTFLRVQMGEQLQQREAALSGFTAWLMNGFDIPWRLDNANFNPEVCKNKTIYAAHQKIAACQDERQVHINRSWYETKMQQKPSAVSDIILHELIRYHVIRLALEQKLSRESQDSIVAEVATSILSPKVSNEELYKTLVRTHLLLDARDTQIKANQARTRILRDMTDVFVQLNDIQKMCRTANPTQRNTLLNLVAQYITVLKKYNDAYSNLSPAEDAAVVTNSNARTISVALTSLQAACNLGFQR